MFTENNIKTATELLVVLKNRGVKLATAESCTGGLIAALFTEISGSSAVFECGFVTYSNKSKTNLLGVDSKLITEYGAVSEEAAKAMAQGAIGRANADIAVAVTGIAGPTGGSAEKPVGTVYIAVGGMAGTICEKNIFSGNRQQIRASAVAYALNMLQKILIKAI